MTGKRPMEVRKIRVKLEDGAIITGNINLRSEYAEGAAESASYPYYGDYSSDAGVFYNRVSDLLSKGKNSFIIIFNVTGEGFDDGGVLMVNKRKILWVFPED